MKRTTHFKWFRATAVWFCCVAMLFMLLPFSVFAQESQQTERRTVRVAFPSQGGMSGVGASGDLVGYNYDYLQELSEYAGWDLEYITFENESADDGIMSAMQMVMDGEADLIGPMLKSEAVEQMFDFPQDNYGVVYTTLCALEKSNITSVNYTKIAPLRVAVYATAKTRNNEVAEYLDQLGIEYTLLSCDSADEQLAMLEDGRADVLSSITLSYFDGTRSVAQFAPRPYYFATTKGNAELLQELDTATLALNYTRPYLQQQLQEEYFGDTSSGYVLSDAELRHMESLETIHVLCASTQDAPYVFQNTDGSATGMLVSLLNDFASSNNIEISYTFCDNVDAAEKEWQMGQYDCLIGTPLSSEYCSQHDMIRTESVTSVDLVLFAKQTTTTPAADSRVAIFDCLAEQLNTEQFASVLIYDSPLECYEAVERGEADYGCSDRLITEYTLYERNSSLVTIPLLGEQEDICIGVARAMGNEFLSALNKYIHTLPDSSKTTYITEGSRHPSHRGVKVWVQENPLRAATIVSAVIILFASTILFALYANHSRKKNLQLQKANAAKSEFLARMSHDIRTPMNAIIGYLSIAKDTEGCPERVEHCIDNSDVAARHLLQLINDVLDMSSIESGKIKIATEEFDLTRVIADAATIFYQNSKAKKVHFETRVIGLDHEWVVGDQLRINQIVMNLLSNAVKFTPEEGKVCFIVEQTGADETGSDVRFTVTDTGIGMSKEYMARLFQPFEQESADTARQYGGSGLGLSIVHSFVTMMGGTITVDSRQNEGSTFTVQLHFAKAVRHPAVVNGLPENTRLRALIVSTSKSQGEEIKAVLDSFGTKADVVTDPEYAVKRMHRRAVSDYPYRLCVLDWRSLDDEAVTTAAGIRAEAAEDKLTIIAVGYDISEFDVDASAAGVNSCVQLPVFRSTWMETLQAIVLGAEHAERSKTKPATMDMKGKRIILAEDNQFNREIAVTVLSKTGAQIDTAEDGEKAVALFETAPVGTYNFILMDVQMPVMDGYQATRAIRESTHPDGKTIPIIAMTANAFAEDVSTALAKGMNAHIAKPVDYEKLYRILGEFAADKHASNISADHFQA